MGLFQRLFGKSKIERDCTLVIESHVADKWMMRPTGFDEYRFIAPDETYIEGGFVVRAVPWYGSTDYDELEGLESARLLTIPETQFLACLRSRIGDDEIKRRRMLIIENVRRQKAQAAKQDQ
ncbi:MAG: hypothetical protein QM811_06915 [Pirellulales bacterium]